jgi:hypothetical protein
MNGPKARPRSSSQRSAGAVDSGAGPYSMVSKISATLMVSSRSALSRGWRKPAE